VNSGRTDSKYFQDCIPSKGEMQRLIGWGAVQSKDRKAVILIDEGAGGSFYKKALKQVWVQMTELLEELRDYPTIWAIRTILGVTKEVDMKFPRIMDRTRFQVLVLDPNLIPESVDVVIGDFIYELHFKVEPEGAQDKVELLEMDDINDARGEGEDKTDLHETNNLQIDNGGVGQRDGGSSSKLNQQPGKSEGQGTTRALFQLHVPDGTDPKENASDTVTELEPDDGGVEHPDVECMTDRTATCTKEVTEVAAHDRVKLLAAIPEVSPLSHRSKRRAENADQTNLKWAEKMKAARNLDASFDQGNTDSAATYFLHFPKEHVVDNLELIGITLGKGES
jgi:hypothetical protein